MGASSGKEVQLSERFHAQAHESKINSISINRPANLFLTASRDGSIKMFNLYSRSLDLMQSSSTGRS